MSSLCAGLHKTVRKIMGTPLKRTNVEISEFDKQLKKEVETAKLLQENRKKKKKSNPKPSKALYDDKGFKLRLNESTVGKNKQVDPDYEVILENNLRKIKPYFFTYKTFCKLRWRDRKLLDVFTSEFRDRDKDYYKKAIEKGSVYLDGQAANVESVIRNGNLITHNIHRHEPPVTSIPVKTVFEDDDILVIDKPSGIPVHPTGRYRFNSITKMIERERGFVVHPCNRLDKQTSGLMFLAKSPKGADDMGNQLKAREVSKEYVARVVGEFPLDEVIVEEPLKTLEPRVALNIVTKHDDADGKHAKTIFKRLSYDGTTSIVQCKPLTGRQHQIRVHLQYLGHPIANDPIYSNPKIWGDGLGRDGIADFQMVIERLYEIGKTRPAQSWYFPDSCGEILLPDRCAECDTSLHTDPDVNDLILWLHAFKYESAVVDDGCDTKKWSYQTGFPDWALEPHKKYMEIALKEAAKCKYVNTAYNVGAVIVNGADILAMGYSRELPGNTHAEQCALDKYFKETGNKMLPKGSVLYTTMEPCSERNSGNKSCLERILEQKGNINAVFYGTREPEKFVKFNKSHYELESNGIQFIEMPEFRELALTTASNTE